MPPTFCIRNLQKYIWIGTMHRKGASIVLMVSVGNSFHCPECSMQLVQVFSWRGVYSPSHVESYIAKLSSVLVCVTSSGRTLKIRKTHLFL